MANFYETFTNFILLALVIFGIFAFIIVGQANNDISNGFANNTLINKTYLQLESNLTNFGTQSNTQRQVFEEDKPTESFGGILLFSIVSSGKVFFSMLGALFNILITLPVVFLGIDPVIVGVFTTLLIVTMIVGLWILYKLG